MLNALQLKRAVRKNDRMLLVVVEQQPTTDGNLSAPDAAMTDLGSDANRPANLPDPDGPDPTGRTEGETSAKPSAPVDPSADLMSATQLNNLLDQYTDRNWPLRCPT